MFNLFNNPIFINILWKIGVYLLIGIVFLFVFYRMIEAENKLVKQQYDNKILQIKLKRQNEVIDSLSLQVREYEKQLSEIKTKTITKYALKEIKDSTCENKLKEISRLVNLWYGIE